MLLFWILLTVVVCFFLYLYMIMPNTSRRSKILPYLNRDYAHRGLHDSSRLIPENSMPAFREAVKQNLAIELDIHLTRDGKVVVFHDESLKRICNAEGTVEGSTFDALQHLHLSGTSEHMPLFSDVLRYVNGRVPLLIELKLPDSNIKLCPAAWDILKDYKGPYMVQSFNSMVSQACASGSSWTAFFCPDSHESGKSFSGALLCTVPADQPDLSSGLYFL